MKFKNGDRVEHRNRGEGIFVEYGRTLDEAAVEFDTNSDAEGDTLTVSTNLLKKVKKHVK